MKLEDVYNFMKYGLCKVHRLAYDLCRNAGCPLLMVDIIALRASAVLRIWEKGQRNAVFLLANW